MPEDHPVRPERPEAQSSAGAFLNPYVGAMPMPMGPTDPIEQAPAEPDDPAETAPQPPHRSTLDILLGRHAPPPKDR